MLLTYENLGNRSQFLNAQNTFNALLQLGVIPIVNENDTVALEVALPPTHTHTRLARPPAAPRAPR